MKSLQITLLFLIFLSCQQKESKVLAVSSTTEPKTFPEKLSQAAISIINPSIDYDAAYFKIDYPNGDVPKGKGVCTDVLIRAYRILDIDLQKEVHEDMVANFSLYPNKKKMGNEQNRHQYRSSKSAKSRSFF